MLKGIQRRMVEVRTDKSSLFETAYFVLRDETAGKTSERNIVDEAYKIISGTLGSTDEKGKKSEKKKNGRRRFVFFAVGFLCGIGSAVSFFILRAFLGL
jgi:hypothetical protein